LIALAYASIFSGHRVLSTKGTERHQVDRRQKKTPAGSWGLGDQDEGRSSSLIVFTPALTGRSQCKFYAAKSALQRLLKNL
jgi:hypothetical protein